SRRRHTSSKRDWSSDVSSSDLGFVNTFKPVNVDLKYANQTVALVTNNVKGQNKEITGETTLAKEQVIRFGFDFFKFAGSAAGTTETGFNDLTFKVSPLEGTNEITGVEDEATTAYNEQLGFDGYGKFENLSYGDYLIEEVEAPEGFQKITPLEIHSTFRENKDDHTQSEDIFTITDN